jgi:hypothetical protein
MAAQVLESRVQGPMSACMFISCVVCRVGSGHCDMLITGTEESYCARVCVCDCV